MPTASLLLLSLLDASSAAEIRPATVPAQGTQEVLVRVERFGRYALEVESPLGAALQLVDAMDGPGPTVGAPGQQDGRLDVFLDVGEHRLRVLLPAASALSEGSPAQARLTVTPAREQRPDPVALPALGQEETTLRDHQQSSWWVLLTPEDAAHPLQIEVAGRHLADVRLWRDGDWLTADTPRCEVRRAIPEHPLRDCLLDARLEPGLYQVVAYGGPGEPWTDGRTDAPLYIRRGVPDLGANGMTRHTLSPFGVDYWRVSADLARLELPAVGPSATVALWETSQGLAYTGRSTASLSPQSRLPVAQVSRSGIRERYLAVTAAPGQDYVLHTLAQAPQGQTLALPRLTAPGWLSVHGLEDPADGGWTGVIVRQTRSQPSLLEQVFAVPLRTDQRYVRRFPARTQQLSVLVEVTTPGTWRFQASGADAQLQIAPFLLVPDPTVQPSPRTATPQVMPLSAGLYVVQVWADAEDGGTVSLDIRPEGAPDTLPLVAARAHIQIPQARFDDAGHTFALTLFGPASTPRALVQHSYPLALEAPLRVSLLPGETVDLPTTLPALMALEVTGDARDVAMSIANGTIIAAGQRTLRFRNEGTAARHFQVRLVRTPQPLPALPASARQHMDTLPLLTATQPFHHTYAAGESATVRLRVEAPGLYEIVSEGLLSMQGAVRTRTVLALDQQSGNGPGRNFRIQQYLRPGDYKVTAQPQGTSAGHASLRLRQTTLHDGGVLRPERPAHMDLSAGDGVVYRLLIPEAGTWHIRASARGDIPRCRLEDADGWPVVPPNQPADLAMHLAPGEYRLVLLPAEVDQQRITALSRVVFPEERSGHGPFRLPLDQPLSHAWTEPSDGGPRQPDRWTFDLTAAADVSIQVSEGMSATLYREDTALPHLQGHLDAGHYTVEVRSQRPDHGRLYTLHAQARQLTPGESRDCAAPCTIPLAVPGGPLEIRTHGDADVRLNLYDAEGQRLLLSSDDRPGDWNALGFLLLPAGTYRAAVLPVGTAAADTTLQLRTPPSRTEAPLAPGETRTLSPGDGLVILPLPPATGEEPLVVLARARAEETVGVAVVQDGVVLSQGTGRDARTGALPARGAPAEIWVWSLDQRGGPVEVTLETTRPRAQGPAHREATLQGEILAGQAAFLFSDAGVRDLSFHTPAPSAAVNSDTDLRACQEGRPCQPVHEHRLTGAGVVIAVPPAVPDQKRLALHSQPAHIQAGQAERVVIPEEGMVWPLASTSGTSSAWATLIVVQSSEGIPMVHLRPAAPPAAVAGQRASDAALDATDAWLWGPGAAQVQVWHFSRPRTHLTLESPMDTLIPPGEAVQIRLPDPDPGPRRLVLDLPAGVAVVASGERNTPPEVRHALDRAESFVLEGAWTELTLLNPGPAPRLARITASLLSEAEAPSLTTTQPLELIAAHRVTRRLALPPLEGALADWTLHLSGAVEAARWLGDAGQTTDRSGPGPLPLASGDSSGTLELRQAPGLAAIWLSGPGGQSTLLSAGAATLPLESTQALPGDQTEVRLHTEADAPRVLRIRADRPMEAEVRTTASGAAGLVEGTLLAAGASPEWVLPAGGIEVLLRGAGGTALQGAVSASPLPRPEPLVEGRNAPVVVGPGEPRWFSILVSESTGSTGLGLGVRADAGDVQARLFSASGALVGVGVGQLHTLSAGSYLLELSVPPEGAPTTAQIGLVGLTPPDLGPPPDVQQHYRAGEAGR